LSGMDAALVYLGLAAASVTAAGLVLLLPRRRGETKRIVVELVCTECGYREFKQFEEGDYVGRVYASRCPRCGGDMVVDAIYEEVVEPVGRRLFVERKARRNK
jgi:ribosomal protein S27AE